MQSKPLSRKTLGGISLVVAAFGLPAVLSALPPSRGLGDALPEVAGQYAKSTPAPNAGLESDIKISPRNETSLPLPKLPGKKSAQSPANPKPVVSLFAGLPLPQARLGMAILTPASNIQVAGASGHKAKPANSQSDALVTVISAAPARDTNRADGPAPAPTKPAAATPKPVPSAKPAANPEPKTVAQAVKTPVPLHRTTQPASSTPSPAPRNQRAPGTSLAQASPSPAPVAATPAPTPQVIIDPHALPEYNLVQLPSQSPAPLPPQSLETKSQDLDGQQGQSLSIRLAGRGWIYTGTGKTPAGVSYLEKSVQADSEQFRFRLDELGHLVLQFQRQDVASGLLDREEVGVNIKQRMVANNNNGMRVQASTNDNSGIGGYQPEYPVPQERVSGTRVLPANANSRQSTQPQREVPSQTVAAVDPNAELSPAQLPADAIGLYALGLQREQNRGSQVSRLCYEKILKDYPAFEKTDDILYRLARILENAKEGKDIRRAYELYVKVQTDYPYSSWADAARDRARYLKRSFFQQ